jgi:hypothetical protein
MSARRWVEVAVVLVVVAIVGGVYWYLHVRTDHTTTAISVDQAVKDFRGASGPTTTAAPPGPTTTAAAPDTTAPGPTTTAPAPVQPAPGVYRYTTTGSDSVDALGGASHQYPATSTITVTAEGCATTQRWAPAEERWDEITSCADGNGVQLQRFVAFHRFFGSDDVETSTCNGAPRPIGAPAGTAWVTQCLTGDDTDTRTGTVVGTEQMTVDGAPVSVEHVAVTIDDGDARDTQRTETWYLAGTDLVVRRVSDIATTEGSPVGDVDYTEHYEIALDSLSPLG